MSNPDTDTGRITGIIQHVHFCCPTFSAGKLNAGKGQLIPFAGKCYVKVGEAVTLTGRWEVSPKYGRQFKVDGQDATEAIDVNGLVAWLTTNASAIGPMRALRIIKEFGDDFANILKNDPQRFSDVAKIPLYLVEELQAKWSDQENVNAVATQLAGFGLTRHQIDTLTTAFGVAAVRIIKDDPYRLMGMFDGFGWRRVDDIAQKIWIVKTAPHRIAAAVVTAVREQLTGGSTCVATELLIDGAAELLALDEPEQPSTIIVATADDLVSEGKQLVRYERAYALPSILNDERLVYDFLKAGHRGNPVIPPSIVGKLVDSFSDLPADAENKKAIQLSDDQRAAVRMAFERQVVLISGGAGAGKTTIIRAIHDAYRHGLGKAVALSAPTGKAARRMEQSIPGVNASTIHRLLEYRPGDGGFQKDESNPIHADCVIVDEVSMMDVQLAASLLRAIPRGCSVVLVGDHNQLPAVGPGAILRDSMKHSILPTYILTHCHRHAGPLKHNATAVLTGDIRSTTPPPAVGPGPWYVHAKLDTPEAVLTCVERLYTEAIPKWCFDPIQQVQFMTIRHKGAIGTIAVNALVQRLHQRSLKNEITPTGPDERPKFYVGDKVIQTKNDYDLNVMNGTIGVVMDADEKIMVVDFQGCGFKAIAREQRGNVELAYCLTPWKMQGSEVPCAITICHSSHAFQLHRNLIYTAVTRATHTSILIGNESGVRQAGRKVEIDQRRTLMELFAAGDQVARLR